MPNKIVSAAALLSVCAFALTGPVCAQAAETNKEALVVEMGAARAKTQLAIQDLQKPLDFSVNGFVNAHNEIYALYQKINAIITRAISEEQAKPVETRNSVRIDTCTKAIQNLADQWADYGKQKGFLDARVAEVNVTYQNLCPAFSQIASCDVYWMRAGIDIKSLTDSFRAVERRALALRAEAGTIVAEQDKNLTEWKTQLGNAEMMAMSK